MGSEPHVRLWRGRGPRRPWKGVKNVPARFAEPGPLSAPEVAAGDLLRALKAIRAALRTMPDIDPFSHGPLATADTLAEMAVAKAEG